MAEPEIILDRLGTEALNFHAQRQGVKMARQLPLVPTIKTTVRFPQELYRRLRIRAIEESRPAAVIIAEAVELYLSDVEAKRNNEAPTA